MQLFHGMNGIDKINTNIVFQSKKFNQFKIIDKLINIHTSMLQFKFQAGIKPQ